jgi:hypothetical protein
MPQPTLLDVMKAKGADAAGLIDEAAKATPEITVVAGRPIKGVDYTTLVRTSNPRPAFRNANEGTATVKGEYVNRRYEAMVIEPRWQCDKAVADASPDGAEMFIAREAKSVLAGTFEQLASQFYYGTANDAKGFPGLASIVTDEMTVDAGGTTAATGSSVWALSLSDEDVQWLLGGDAEMNLTPVREETLYDGSSKPYRGYVQDMLLRVGLKVGNLKALGRIVNLTADSGKGLTDDAIYDLLALFPVGKQPTHLFMSRRSRKQLQSSRTKTSLTGAPAPMPTEVDGIPIVPTESIVDTEALI